MKRQKTQACYWRLLGEHRDRQGFLGWLSGRQWRICFTHPSWMGCSVQSPLWTAETSVSQPFLLTGWPLLSDFLLPLVFSGKHISAPLISLHVGTCVLWEAAEEQRALEDLKVQKSGQGSTSFHCHNFPLPHVSAPWLLSPHMHAFLFSVWKWENTTFPLSGFSPLHQRITSPSSPSPRTELAALAVVAGPQ